MAQEVNSRHTCGAKQREDEQDTSTSRLPFLASRAMEQGQDWWGKLPCTLSSCIG